MSSTDKQTLQAWVRAPSTPQKIVLRSRICLLAHQGLPNQKIASRLGTSRPSVLLWRKRFAQGGVIALEHDAPHGPSAQALNRAQVKALVEATLQRTPAQATHWSTRTLAKE